MATRSYTIHDVPETISCKKAMDTYVDEFLPGRERVCRLLATVEESIRKGLSKGISRQKLLNFVNNSDELRGQKPISLYEFRRYCLEQFPQSKSNKNGKLARRNDDFEQAVSERIERRGRV
jgi:hypothetical protein